MKICIATGTRAEYGLLKPLMDEIIKIHEWELQVLVTGAHLSPEFGLTVRQIEKDQMPIAARVDMLLSSDTDTGIAKSIGIGLIGCADAFKILQPDLLIILGDRYEMLSVAAAALIYKIPIAHLHGGEVTEGAYDDAIRHALTKMSLLHFASTEIYRQRIIQMGEAPERVFNTGAPGLDNIRNMQLLSRDELERELKVIFKEKIYLITYHPATLDQVEASTQFRLLLDALEDSYNATLIFTKANADTDGRIINEMIDAYALTRPGEVLVYTSMGQLRYLSAMQHANLVIGNSSSGIIEAPAFGVPTVNIGDRQKGRVRARSILDCSNETEEIRAAIQMADHPDFRQQIKNMHHPYGAGSTARKIIQVLKGFQGHLSVQKTFFDLTPAG